MCWYGGLLRKAKKNEKKNRGMCEDTGWATRLRKRGKSRKYLRGACEDDSGQATRLRKSGKKKVEEGTV